MKLYGSQTSPYVRKVRVFLKEKQIACDFVLADAWSTDSIVPSLNPLGKVPVLQLDDGQVYFDSPTLVDYLDALQGEPLIPPHGDARWHVLRWHALGQGILDAVVIRLLETRRPPGQRSTDVIARQEEKIANALRYANAAPRGRNYLVDERFSLADIAIGVALDYVDFRYPHDWRALHPRLAHWLSGIDTRPSFAETMPPGFERVPGSPH